jgi:hypothetical protein
MAQASKGDRIPALMASVRASSKRLFAFMTPEKQPQCQAKTRQNGTR